MVQPQLEIKPHAAAQVPPAPQVTETKGKYPKLRQKYFTGNINEIRKHRVAATILITVVYKIG